MKIEAPSDIPAGDSTAENHTGEVEILAFEHVLSRAPGRASRSDVEDAATKRRRAAKWRNPRGGQARMPEGYRSTLANVEREAEDATRRLASMLEQHPVSVLKLIDKSTPMLNLWATKTDALLTSVTLTCCSTIASGGKTQLKNLLQIKLLDAFICDVEVVGSYPDQPWLTGGSPAEWQTMAPLRRGPVEKLLFAYKKIEWHVDTQRTFGWDVLGKTSF